MTRQYQISNAIGTNYFTTFLQILQIFTSSQLGLPLTLCLMRILQTEEQKQWPNSKDMIFIDG